jgi:hypothetical protein
VDTIVRPPTAPPTEPVEATRRRWPRRVSVAALVLALAIVGSGSVWVANHDPFSPGSIGFAPPRHVSRVIEVDAFDRTGRVFVVRTSGPSVIRYRFSIRNDGPVAITIGRIGLTRSDQEDIVITRFPVRLIPDLWRRNGDPRLPSFEPWHPFTLQPDQEAAIEMEATLKQPCLERGTHLSWWSEEISFSILGIPRTETFESDLEVRFVGTGAC